MPLYNILKDHYAVKDHRSHVWHICHPENINLLFYPDVSFAVVEIAQTNCGLCVSDPETGKHPKVYATVLHSGETDIRLCEHCANHQRNPRSDWRKDF